MHVTVENKQWPLSGYGWVPRNVRICSLLQDHDTENWRYHNNACLPGSIFIFIQTFTMFFCRQTSDFWPPFAKLRDRATSHIIKYVEWNIRRNSMECKNFMDHKMQLNCNVKVLSKVGMTKLKTNSSCVFRYYAKLMFWTNKIMLKKTTLTR